MNQVAEQLDVIGDALQRAWRDDLQRHRRPAWRARSRLGVMVALLTLVLAAPGLGIGSRLLDLFAGSPVDTQRLSGEELHVLSAMAHGLSPRVPASNEVDLARLEVASLRQIATRDGRVYFVADRQGGGHCVTIGSSGDRNLFGSIVCSPDFPSVSRPILDQSVFGPITEPHAIRLEGFASDVVAAVALVMPSGNLEALTPVEDNVYLRTEGLPSAPVRALVALDASGQRVYTQCFAADGCE